MKSQDKLIKKVAEKFDWSIADVKRAVEDYGDFSTEEEVIACCLRYSGIELKRRNYQIAAQKRVNSRQKVQIEKLVNQLISIQDFYQNQLVPNLKATIEAQAEYIAELLKKMPWTSRGED